MIALPGGGATLNAQLSTLNSQRHLLREVGQDNVRAGAFNGQQGFVARGMIVESAELCGRVDLGVFAAH
jgi:hypothetical protein